MRAVRRPLLYSVALRSRSEDRSRASATSTSTFQQRCHRKPLAEGVAFSEARPRCEGLPPEAGAPRRLRGRDCWCHHVRGGRGVGCLADAMLLSPDWTRSLMRGISDSLTRDSLDRDSSAGAMRARAPLAPCPHAHPFSCFRALLGRLVPC